MLYEEIILFSQRRESWSSEAVIAGNKLSGFPFCSATSSMFYQSRSAGKDFVFPHCNLILSSVELRCILNTKLNCSLSMYPPREEAGLCLDCHYLKGTFLVCRFEDICPLKWSFSVPQNIAHRTLLNWMLPHLSSENSFHWFVSRWGRTSNWINGFFQKIQIFKGNMEFESPF